MRYSNTVTKAIYKNFSVSGSRHPCYNEQDMILYRDTWVGGQDYIDKYLKTYSAREQPDELQTRKQYSYNPAIAKSCVIEVKNSISQRFNEITRKGGPKTYLAACNGDKWGVDKLGSSMNSFTNREILPELLVMGRVGVWIDAPQLPDDRTLADKARPYIYTFKSEDILSWVPDESSEPNQFSLLLLREHYATVDSMTGLPCMMDHRFRYVKKEGDKVVVKYYNSSDKQVDQINELSSKTYTLDLKVIPFVVYEISTSILADAAKYQIALLNMASSDVSYSLRANFPFYIEQFNAKNEDPYSKGTNAPSRRGEAIVTDGNTRRRTPSDTATKEVKVGIVSGRRYPENTNPPAFIHPSPEPLLASMKKQEQIKAEMREIIKNTMANMSAMSLDTEQQDKNDTYESGLHNIGLELEQGERRIAYIWALYGGSEDSSVITYPQNYKFKSDADRLENAKKISELKTGIPSKKYQKEAAKQQIIEQFQGKVPSDVLETMLSEVDKAKTMTSNVDEISQDLENGLVTEETASDARGYEPGEVEKARQQHADRLARIQKAQSSMGFAGGARGVPDAGSSQDGKLEKKVSKIRKDGLKKRSAVRGEGK